MVINQKALAKIIAPSLGMSIVDAEKVIRVIRDEIARLLIEGEAVRIRGLGTFGTKVRKERSFKSGICDDIVNLAERTVVSFRPSKWLNDILSDEEEEEQEV